MVGTDEVYVLVFFLRVFLLSVYESKRFHRKYNPYNRTFDAKLPRQQEPNTTKFINENSNNNN